MTLLFVKKFKNFKFKKSEYIFEYVNLFCLPPSVTVAFLHIISLSKVTCVLGLNLGTEKGAPPLCQPIGALPLKEADKCLNSRNILSHRE
jgi:hypothetical protein